MPALFTALIPAFLIALVAAAFGGWPIGASFYKIPAIWANIILSWVTALSLLAFYGPHLNTKDITTQQIVMMIGLGLLNTAGMWAFGVILWKYPQFVPIAQTAIPVGGFIGALWFLRMPTTPGQIVCMIVASVAILGMFWFAPPTTTP